MQNSKTGFGTSAPIQWSSHSLHRPVTRILGEAALRLRGVMRVGGR
jgi:hypothetical protein